MNYKGVINISQILDVHNIKKMIHKQYSSDTAMVYVFILLVYLIQPTHFLCNVLNKKTLLKYHIIYTRSSISLDKNKEDLFLIHIIIGNKNK